MPELLVNAAESIIFSIASATNKSSDAAQSLKPPSKKREVYWIIHLVRKSRMMNQVSKMR